MRTEPIIKTDCIHTVVPRQSFTNSDLSLCSHTNARDKEQAITASGLCLEARRAPACPSAVGFRWGTATRRAQSTGAGFLLSKKMLLSVLESAVNILRGNSLKKRELCGPEMLIKCCARVSSRCINNWLKNSYTDVGEDVRHIKL